ncbi:cytotoxic necrotizing factor Rho-activating domain-containing protein [Paraburkholderia sp. IW21]|uniref:cytotoxic necrotizing factor Rho-activating domain-containing protein n=1 Tax=Paraburkholderia sp. IW21 TaxID=3242488 RepID=UPI003521F611
MRSYAENDSKIKKKQPRHDDAVEQPDVAQSRWADQVERIGCNGEWNFELADSMPFLVSELPCWKDGGLALHVWNGRTHASFGASAHSVGDVCIEVMGGHYWALIDGQRVWIRPDGNCFFAAIWKALQACGNLDAVKRIFRGRVPVNEREASDYFRREIRDHLRKHPELEAILLGDDGSPAARRSQPRSGYEVRKTPGDPKRESLSARDAAIGNGIGAIPEHFRVLQGLQGEADERDADQFLDASATADWLVQPGEQREKPAVEPHQAGSNEASRPQKRVRRLTPFANPYRSASGIDQETPENGLFRTAADIAKRAGERISRPAAVASRVYRERQEIFRALGADDVLKALSPVLIPDGFEDAACDADWLPQTAQDAGLAESDRDEMAALLRTPTKVKWSTPLVEYRPIPHARHTEFQRVLFSAGSQLSGWLAYSGLLSFGYWALAKVSPMASVVAAAGTTVCNLVSALKQRDVLGGLVQVLLALPYQLLSPQSLLFAIAEETKRYIDEVLDGVTPECLTSQRENIYMGVGLVALFSYYGYFVKRQAVNPLVSKVLHGPAVYPPNGFLYENDMQPPETPLGQAMAGVIGKLQRAVQGYAVLRAVVDAKPPTSLATVVEPVCSVDDDPNAVSREDKAWQKLHRQTMKEPHKAWLRAYAAERRREAALETASLPASAIGGQDEPDAIFKAANNVPESSPESFSTSLTQAEENFASSPQDSASSDAPETRPFIALPIATAAAAAAPCLLGGLCPPSRQAVVVGTVSIVTIASIVAYFVQLGLTIPKDGDDPDFEILQADAQPLSQEYHDTNADMQTPNFRWLYLEGQNLASVKYFMETQFDHQFFEDALVAVFAPDNKNQTAGSEKATYETAVRSAWGDYIRDVGIPLRYRSSEDPYGPELYSIIREIDPVDNYASEKLRRLKSILIKIKTYETFILRERRGLHFDSKEGVIAKLESIFGLPIEIPENAIFTEALDDHINTRLGYDSNTTVPVEVANGVRTAISAWDDATTQFLKEKSGIPETAISAARQSIADKIKQEKEEIYKFRGPRDQERLERSKKKLAEYRYAVHYLEDHIKLSHNFLGALNEIKPILQKIEPRLSTLSDQLGDATVFYARVLAVKAALKMLGKRPRPADSDNPSVLGDLSDVDYLDNFSLIIASSPEMTTFISLAEAIFYKALIGLDINNLHQNANNPAELILAFKRAIDSSPISNRYGSVATEGANFVRNIATSDKTSDDTEYYRQFSEFKSKYHNAVAKSISYFALSEYGMHPYLMLTEKPLRVVKMTLYMRPKTPRFPKPSRDDLLGKFLNSFGGFSNSITIYGKAGELIFCEMPTQDWIVISTLGGSCVVRSSTAAQMNQNPGLRDISQEQGTLKIDYIGPFIDQVLLDRAGIHPLWIGQNMITFIVRPIFGNASIINENSFENAYLHLNGDARRNFNGKSLLTIVDEATNDALLTLMAQAKEAKYNREWWQYITSLIPGFDMLYRLDHDPDYTPSAGEISLEVVSAVLTLTAIAFPAGALTAGSAKILRASLLKNLAKGLRGAALYMAVWAEVGSTLAFFPLRILAIAGYEIFAFWEPLPLRALTKSLYKNVRKFKFDLKFKKVKPKTFPNPEIKTLSQDAHDVAKSGIPEPAEARGLLVSLHQNDVRYYEYSYSYAKETPLGTGKLPDVDAAAPGEPKQPTPSADFGALNDEGAIELSPSRAITRIETPFRYSRTDAIASPEAVSSLGDEGRHLAFESMEQGIARDIEFHRQPLAPFGYGGHSSIDANTEVILLRESPDSAVGVRMDFENIAPDRPLLVTSGEMSDGTFLVGIDEADACAYFYRLGDIGSNSADPASDNIAIRRLFETHNSLATRTEMRISIPVSVQKPDLLWFSRKFDKTMVIYAENPRTSGFTVLDPDFDLSAQPGAKPPTRHSASSSSLDLVNYNHAQGDINIIQSSGNAYCLLSRKDNDHVSIIGRAQYRGNVDTSQPKPWQPGAEDGKGSEFATSDIRQIMDLLAKSGKQVSSHIRVLNPDHLKAVEAAGRYFLANGYNVRYRIAVIWPSKESDNIIQHYAPVIETNGRTYLADIAAGRFSSQGINDPICATDSSWRTRYISSFPDHVILIRDINSFDSLTDLVKTGPVGKNMASELSDPDWTVLNKPSWTLMKASEVTEAINTDLIIDIGASRNQRGYLDLNPVETLPSLPMERIAKWNTVMTERGFADALTGSPSVAAEKIQAFLIEKNIKSKIIMTKRYENFYDENPATNYAIQAEFPDEPADVITLRPARYGNGSAVAGVGPLKRWQSENRHKITFFRLIEDPKTIPDFLDANDAPQEIGQSHFFNEMTNRYCLMHFDPAAMSSLEEAMARIRTEMAKYSGPYLGNDLRTERSILDQYRLKQPKNQMNIRIQQTKVDEITNYQFLRGLLGRMEDLHGKIRGEVSGDMRLERNPGKRMIGKVITLEAHALKNSLFNKISVKKYDPSTGNYITNPSFSVVRAPDLKYLFGEVELNHILSEYSTLYHEIYDMAIAYSIEGRLEKGRNIVKNAHLGIEMCERLIRHSDLNYNENLYALIDKNNFNTQNPSAYGLSLVLHVLEKDEILHLDTMVAHPFTQLRNEQDFVDYAIRHGAEWNLQELERYRIEGADRFLGYHTAKKSLAESGTKYISMQARNPRAENIASAFGLEEMNDLEFYGLDVSLKAAKDARRSLLRAIFQTVSSKQKPKSDPKIEPVVAPPAGPYGKLEMQWRREDVSLNQEKPGDAGDRFEGIYSVPVAGTSKSPDEWKYYIKEENNPYEVRWDDDARTWRVVNPLDPGRFGHAVPVKLDDTGHWVTHLDIPIEKGGSPFSGAGKVSHLINLSETQSQEMRSLVRRGRKQALNNIDGALKALGRKNTEKVDAAMDIFFGRHNDVVKEVYRFSLNEIQKFLNELDIINDISYKAGYFDPKQILMRTKVNSALTNWKDGLPPITVSVDALADVSLRKRFTLSEFENFLGCTLIHESYHAVSSTAYDFAYPIIRDGSLDISPLIILRDPWLFGDDVHEIMKEHDLSRDELMDRRERSFRRAFYNADNLAFLTVLLSNLDDRSPWYRNFIPEYNKLIADNNLPLEWKFKGHNKGGPIRLKTRTAIGQLVGRDMTPLIQNGLLYKTSSSRIPVNFDALTPGLPKAEKFSLENGKFSDFLDTWQGGSTTSLKCDVWSGTWGREHFLDNDFSVIEIRGEKSETAAIRINLNDLEEDHPLIISGGELGGSTIAFASSEDGFLYVFHAGHKAGDPNWQPSQQGVAGIYQAYRSMGGKAIPGLKISDAGVLVNEGGDSLGHRALREILGGYKQSFVAYSGQLSDSSPGSVSAGATAKWVDYAQLPQGKGRAYALVQKQNGEVQIDFYAKEAPPVQASSGAKPKKPGA